MKADIFFVIASAATVIVSIAIVIAALYLIRVLRDARDISVMIKEESGRVIQDVENLRAEGAGVLRALRFFWKKNRSARRRRKERGAGTPESN